MKPALTWTIAASGLLLLSGAMGWATWSLVGMERMRHRMEANAVVQERTRLALWRMESVAASLVLEESARAPEQYNSPALATNHSDDSSGGSGSGTGSSGAASGGVLFPADPSGRIQLHFEMDADGRLHSPQVPDGPDKPPVSGESARLLQELRSRLAEKASPGQWASLGLDPSRFGRSTFADNKTWLSYANDSKSVAPPPETATASPPPADLGEKDGQRTSAPAYARNLGSEGYSPSAAPRAAPSRRKSERADENLIAQQEQQQEPMTLQQQQQQQEYTPAQLPSTLKPAELQRGQELYNQIEAETRRRVFSEAGKNITQNRSPLPPEKADSKPAGKPEIAARTNGEDLSKKSADARRDSKDGEDEPAGSKSAETKSRKNQALAAVPKAVDSPAEPEAAQETQRTKRTEETKETKETQENVAASDTAKGDSHAFATATAPTSPMAPASVSAEHAGTRGHSPEGETAGGTRGFARSLAPAPGAAEPAPDAVIPSLGIADHNKASAPTAFDSVLRHQAEAPGAPQSFGSDPFGDAPPTTSAAAPAFGGLSGIATANATVSVTVSDFRALWIKDALLLTRRVSRGGTVTIQGAWVDWPKLRANLLATVSDLFPSPALEPAPPLSLTARTGGTDLLASLPLRFLPGPLELPAPPFWSPLKLSLATAWACVLLATAAVVLVLRGMMLLSNRRASFVSAVTHELRTPLATFKLYSEMLADGMVKEETKRQRYLETLSTEADRLGHLVENVLSYSRIESGKVPAGRAPVAVHELLQRLAPRLSQRCEQAGAEWDISAGTLPENLSLTTDPAAVEQILFNLVDNACKYARRDGAAARVELDVHLHKNRVLFAVRDYGPGISRAESRKLFRPFHKSARDAAHSAPGVGLGLALCRRLAGDLGGTLESDHSWPHGACFVLRLPL